MFETRTVHNSVGTATHAVPTLEHTVPARPARQTRPNIACATTKAHCNTCVCRREALAAAVGAALLIQSSALRTCAAQVPPRDAVAPSAPTITLTVGASDTRATTDGPTYPTIRAALASVEGSVQPVVIRVAPGTYNERLVITRPNITIQAWPQGAAVQVVWRTPEPYQSVLDVSVPGVTVQGLTLRHTSKSVANNYAVYIHGEPNVDTRLVECDISSATGSGVGVEGTAPQLTACRIHDCVQHGVAVFGPLDPLLTPPGGGTLLDCDVSGNGGNGVLVRQGAAPVVQRCIVHDNKGWGISLQDASGELLANSVRGNGRGAVQVQASFDLDTDLLPSTNTLLGKLLVQF